MKIRLEMKNYNIILIERLQKYQLYENLNGKEILPSNQQQIIKQAKFTYFLLGKAFENKQKQSNIKEKNKLML